MCVSVASAEPACGPAQIDWIDRNRARLRIGDLVYALRLRTSQVDVMLKQGAMQIDGFTAAYEWEGTALRFADPDKNVRYEVRSEAALKARPREPRNARPAARLDAPDAPPMAPNPAPAPASSSAAVAR